MSKVKTSKQMKKELKKIIDKYEIDDYVCIEGRGLIKIAIVSTEHKEYLNKRIVKDDNL